MVFPGRVLAGLWKEAHGRRTRRRRMGRRRRRSGGGDGMEITEANIVV